MKSTTEKKLEKGYSVMDNFARSDGLGDCFAELLLCSEDVDRAPLRIVFVFTSMTSVSSSKRRGDIGRLSPWSAPLRMFFSFESFFMMPILSSMISIVVVWCNLGPAAPGHEKYNLGLKSPRL